MGTTDLTDTKANGNVAEADDVNDLRGALVGDFVGRDGSTKAVTSGQRLGTPAVPWGNAYVGALVVAGATIDFSALGGNIPNAIISGATVSNSQKSDFLRAAGSSAEVTLLGATTTLSLNIDSTGIEFTTDVTESSLTTAPSSSNTCLVNEADFSDQDATRYAGEDGSILNIDSAGSEITNRVGQYVTLKGASEYMLAYVKSSTELSNIYRGFYFDNSGDAINRETLANNDTLTIMSTAWVFAENNGTTIDVTYVSPIYDYTEPSSPATGDYWFDMLNQTWKRYSGSAFVQINRILIGVAVIDATNCVAARSFDFDKTIYNFNPIELEYDNVGTIRTVQTDFNLGVYGGIVVNRKTPFVWDITTDLESGQSEASNTVYYAYISEVGQPILSETAPYNQKGDLGGYYHPHESWRCVGYINNNGSTNFDEKSIVDFSDRFTKIEVIESSQTWFKPVGVSRVKATVIGGGGGSSFSNTTSAAGGSSSFSSYASATGGAGSGRENNFAPGGVGSTGDVNLTGGEGKTAVRRTSSATFLAPLGGDSILGGGKTNAGGANYGGGAGFTSTAGEAGPGAGAGGASIANISLNDKGLGYSITIGAGGSGTNDGGDGVVILEY